MSLLVLDQPGVMQRVMQVFTKKKVNVETIVVGKCEKPAMARIVLTVADEAQGRKILEHVRRVEPVLEAEIVDPRRWEAYLAVDQGGRPAFYRGSVEDLSAKVKGLGEETRYILTINAL
jgi:acetolactate synthase-1/3 small subunit